MKRLLILGSSGSIGQTALTAITTKRLPLRVVGLSSHTNESQLLKDAMSVGAEAVCLTGANLESREDLKTYCGRDGLLAMIAECEVDIVLNAISGFAGLAASLAVLEAGYDLALANKESVVCGAHLLFDCARTSGSKIIPVDSEHSALNALLKGQRREDVHSLILTASGGPFKNLKPSQFEQITASDALDHPTWQMGKKITIDSATLANKALEVIEASYLFDFPHDRIEVVVHPQSIIHSMIRTNDGALYAQLSRPDMSLAIVGALLEGPVDLVKPLNFAGLSLTFEEPKWDHFPLLGAAFDILRRNDSSAIAFNAADEVAVQAFLEGSLSYPRMIEVILTTLQERWDTKAEDWADVVAIDKEARRYAQGLL
jgi:1-deoxy-D-xylulose-5-phosphate reductoisomerase